MTRGRVNASVFRVNTSLARLRHAFDNKCRLQAIEARRGASQRVTGESEQMRAGAGLLVVLIALGASIGHAAVYENGDGFEYHQVVLPTSRGFVSSLNNCGVHLSQDGANLRGRGNSQALWAGSTSAYTVLTLAEYNGGLVTAFSNGEVYFSPDWGNLSGGGNTVRIGTYSASSRVERILPLGDRLIAGLRDGRVFMTDSLNSLGGEDPSRSRLLYSGPASVTAMLVKSQRLIVAFANGLVIQSRSFDGASPARVLQAGGSEVVTAMADYNGATIVGYAGGRIDRVDDHALFTDSSKQTLIHRGVAASQITTGRNFLFLGGEVPLALPLNRYLLIAYKDGYVVLSDDIDDLDPESPSVIELARPVQNIANETVVGLYQLEPNRYKSFDLATLNDTLHIGRGINVETTYRVISVDMSGRPASAEYEKKSWHDWEYKWNSLGTKTGYFEYTSDGGDTIYHSLRTKPRDACVAFFTYHHSDLGYWVGLSRYFDAVDTQETATTRFPNGIDYDFETDPYQALLEQIKELYDAYRGKVEIIVYE